MEGAALAPPRQVQRQGYLIITILLGIIGAGVAMAAFAKGSYRVGPLIVEMSVKPATKGTTTLIVSYAQLGLTAGTTKADTHAGFLAFQGDVTGIYGPGFAASALTETKDPAALAATIRDDGKKAMQKFLLKTGLVVLAGSAAGGFAIALVGLKTRRIFQGMLAGVLVVGALGILAWKTYDIDKFSTAKFSPPAVSTKR